MRNQVFTYHFFDFETGGSKVEGDFPTIPIQFAAVITDRQLNVLDRIEVFIKFDDTNYFWSEEAEGIHKISQRTLEDVGVEEDEARKMIIEFLERNGFGKPNSYNPKYLYRTTPAGQNVDFDKGILQDFLGQSVFDKYFSYHKLDTMPIASFINDLYVHRGGKAPFRKKSGDKMVASSSLDAMRMAFNIPTKGNHDARIDTNHTIASYKGMLTLMNNKLSDSYHAKDFKEKAIDLVGPEHEHHSFKSQIMNNPEELFNLVCKFIDSGKVV
jgi:exonuclease I